MPLLLVSVFLLGRAHGQKTQENAITNSIGMSLRRIKAGDFVMGKPEGGRRNILGDKAPHRVSIGSDFFIGVMELTQSEWRAVMGTEPWLMEKYVKVGSNYPATYISFDEAVSFCERLSQKEGAKYRLPTDIEWEYACRAGSSTKYCFGDSKEQLHHYAWFSRSVGKEFHPHLVGQKRPNAWGLYDMHGNVGEWITTADDSAKSIEREWRSGCWFCDEVECGSGERFIMLNRRLSHIGLRVVCEINDETLHSSRSGNAVNQTSAGTTSVTDDRHSRYCWRLGSDYHRHRGLVLCVGDRCRKLKARQLSR
jgi:formylglycine-generating enzyme